MECHARQWSETVLNDSHYVQARLGLVFGKYCFFKRIIDATHAQTYVLQVNGNTICFHILSDHQGRGFRSCYEEALSRSRIGITAVTLADQLPVLENSHVSSLGNGQSGSC